MAVASEMGCPSRVRTGVDLRWLTRQARPRRLRSMRQFAEQELIVPAGLFRGRRFRCDRQPYTALWFEQVDSGQWNRCVATGPTQSGKSLTCFVIPLLYNLFEMQETVICGLPDMDMAADTWREDLLPAIEHSRYRDLLPASGGGSRGGRVESLQFRNGATLKFMSGGGSDKSRAGFTARVVVMTETDGLDEIGGRSRERDKLTQLEARTRAYGHRKRIYMECTVSTETGRTWQECTHGTKSRIVLPCPGCGKWVTPEREHLTAWQGTESQAAARATGTFACPACGQVWDEAERVQANPRGRLLHEGQSIGDDGAVVGAAPATDTLGFRWSAVNNLLLTAGDLAADEWKASQSTDEENAERAMRQFVWCLPITPSKLQQINLEVHALSARTLELPKGTVPAGIACVTVGIDCGKYLLDWAAVAWTHPGASGHILDYGRHEVASADLGVEPALMAALRELREELNAGWPSADPKLAGQQVVPAMTFVDAGYMTEVIYAFCRESASKYFPAVGRGASQRKDREVNFQTQTGSVVKTVGEGYRAVWLPAAQVHLVEADADHWKTWVHQRLSTPLGTAGA